MKQKINIPNVLTWLRIVLIPLFVTIFFLPFSWVHQLVTAIFVIAAVTDWFDGYLARKWNQTSNLGAFLDPVADKLMVAAAIILIVYQDSKLYQDPRWFLTACAIVIISREITISALREWMANLGKRGVVAVSWIGKWKTAVQMISLILLLYKEPIFGIDVYNIGVWGLVVATILTLWSMIHYLLSAWKVLNVPSEDELNES